MLKEMAAQILAELKAHAETPYLYLEDPDLLSVIEQAIKGFREKQKEWLDKP